MKKFFYLSALPILAPLGSFLLTKQVLKKV